MKVESIEWVEKSSWCVVYGSVGGHVIFEIYDYGNGHELAGALARETYLFGVKSQVNTPLQQAKDKAQEILEEFVGGAVDE